MYKTVKQYWKTVSGTKRGILTRYADQQGLKNAAAVNMFSTATLQLHSVSS